MSGGEAAQVVLDYLSALNRRDMDAALEFFAEDAEIWVAGRTYSRSEFISTLATVTEIFVEGPRLEPIHHFSAGPRTVVEMTVEARTRAGKDYRNQYAMVAEIRDSKIASLHEYLDSAPLNEALS